MTSRPRINLVLYHGVLAPHARWRARVVADGALPAAPVPPGSPNGNDAAATPTPRRWSWAKLMHRAFELDVLACPRCGGRMRLLATVEDPREIQEILSALALSASPMDRAPPLIKSVDANPTAAVCA